MSKKNNSGQRQPNFQDSSNFSSNKQDQIKKAKKVGR